MPVDDFDFLPEYVQKGPEGPSGAQRGRGRDWSEAGLFSSGFTYGGSVRVDSGARKSLVCQISGADPGRSIQVAIKVESLQASDTPRARIFATYGTGATTTTIELVGGQSFTLGCTTLKIEATLEGSSTVPVQVTALLSYGASSCEKGARWRSPLFNLAALGTLAFEVPDCFEATLYSVSAGADFTVQQWVDTTLGIAVVTTEKRGVPFRVLPGTRRISVTSADAFAQGVTLGLELIP